VKSVQQAIMATGMYLRGGADGVFGQATHNALVLYQRANGLTADGVVSEATARLMGLGSSSGTPSGVTGGGTTAAGFAVYDERGARVVALQQALIRAGIPVPGGADGAFGSGTLGAVRAFQLAKGLPATGKVDQATANALGLSPQNAPAPEPAVNIVLQARPVGGACWYGDTWQASRSGGRLHLGTDIGGAEGTPLRAVVSGVISQMYHDQVGSLSGNGLKVAMADGTYFFYAHLSGFAPGIAVGTRVQAGQVIGYMGRTGNAGITHLHFEVHPRGGSAVNPYPILRAYGACP
jgi:murein DD-endopeptidase MepM/ murein hydrolase activator NlpD